ncbi:MAG: BspA family leucine-rich repeat surface protein, partial [Campylobacter sp.]|nr:BspA family leucine-rich repeat surface protein [Campylobacter sp.]
DFSGIEEWDVSHVTDMNNMFQSATSFNQPLDNWDVSNVTNMSGMFVDAIAKRIAKIF